MSLKIPFSILNIFFPKILTASKALHETAHPSKVYGVKMRTIEYVGHILHFRINFTETLARV